MGRTQPEFWGAAPNPFQGRTTVRFALPEETEARLQVFDLNGRCLRTLHTGLARPGPIAIEWDGRDDAARPLPTGVYLLRLSTPTKTEIRTAVLCR